MALTSTSFFLPEVYRDIALAGLHDQGRDRTMSLVKSRFYWPGMDGDVKKYVRKCLRRKAKGNTAAKLVVVDSTYPMDLVFMGFLSLEMSAGGFGHILVITDHFTRYAQAILTRNQLAKPLPEFCLIISSATMASLIIKSLQPGNFFH